MKKTAVSFLTSLFIASQALAGDLNLGVKLFKDGLYDLAAKTFESNLKSLDQQNFKEFYKYIYLSFIKSNDVKGLESLLKYWNENFPNFRRGEFLALKLFLDLKKGKPIEEAFPTEVYSLPISEKISFFKTLKEFDSNSQQTLYILATASKDLELKGAVKEGGFLDKALKKAIKNKDSQTIDFIFDNFGRWFTSFPEKLQFIKYLERKKRFTDALVEAQKLFKENPSHQVKLELAKALYLNNRYKEALKLLDSPKTEEEKYLKAWCFFKLGQSKKIPKTLGIKIEKPQIPENLKTLLNFYSANFNLEKLKKLYPDLYAKSLIFSFSTQIPTIGNPNDLGYIYYERGLYNKALKTLEKAIQNPSDKTLTPRTLFIIGKLGSLNTQIGTVAYNQLLNNFQQSPYYKESLIPAAQIYLYSGNNLLALKLLKYAEEQLTPPPARIKNLEGIALMNMENYKQAAQKFLTSKEKNGEIRTFEAYCLYQIKNFKGTYKVLKYLVKRNDIYPQVNEGRLIYLLKKLKKEKELNNFKFHSPLTSLMAAITAKNLQQIKNIYPSLKQKERIVADLFLALNYEKNNPEKALNFASDIYARATDNSTSSFAKQLLQYLAYKSNNFTYILPNDPKFILYNPENGITSIDTLITKSDDLTENGELNEAYGLLKLALERTNLPQVKRAIVERMVQIDIKEGNYSKALKDLNLFPDTEKDEDLKNFYKFKIYDRMNRVLDAFNTAQKIKDIKDLPLNEQPNFLAKLSHYYKLAGEKEKALKILEYLVNNTDLSKIDYDNLVKLGIFAENENRLDLAQKLFQEAIKKAQTPQQKAESLFWQASLLEKEGKEDEALINYLKISYDFSNVEPWSSTATYRAAEILEKEGKLEQALKLYEKAAKMKKGTEEGEMAREKVKSLMQRLQRRDNGD